MSDKEYEALLQAIKTSGMRPVLSLAVGLILLGATFGAWIATLESRVEALESTGRSMSQSLEKIIHKLDVNAERLSRIEGKIN